MSLDPGNGNLSVASLFNTLMHDVTLLFRKEFELARSEISVKVSEMSNGVIMIGAAAVAGLAALLFVMTAATFAIALVLPAWAAALIVAGIVGILAVALFSIGRNRLKAEHMVPERTVRTLRDDAEFTRQQFRGGGHG
jgi:hypothetical protein